jgi:hypothetical protein
MERMNARKARKNGPKLKSPLALTLKETQNNRQSWIGNVCYWSATRSGRALDTRMVDSPMEIRSY